MRCECGVSFEMEIENSWVGRQGQAIGCRN